MSYRIKYTNTFKKDLARCEKRGYDMDLAETPLICCQKTENYPRTINRIN